MSSTRGQGRSQNLYLWGGPSGSQGGASQLSNNLDVYSINENILKIVLNKNKI